MRTLVVMLLLGAAACGGSSSAAGGGGTTVTAPTEADCPVAVPGTSVTAMDTDTGAALVFVTTGDVAAVHARVDQWAEVHNQRHEAMGPLPTGDEPAMTHDHAAMTHDHAAMTHDHAGMDHGDAGGDFKEMITVHSRASVEDEDGTIRLVFTTSGDQVGALRDQLRMHAQHLASGTCAMGAHHGM